MLKLLLASTNQGKLAEMKTLLSDLPIELLSPTDLNLDLEVAETGKTYAENAALKALAFMRHSGLVTLADDSGLEVDALDGLPGIYSARFAPIDGATDADRRHYLLERLRDRPQPWTARFRCIVAIANLEGKVSFSEGICSGIIIPEERGDHGFGYDPIFYLPDFGKTMAELTMEEKNLISHRALAVKAAISVLRQMNG